MEQHFTCTAWQNHWSPQNSQTSKYYQSNDYWMWNFLKHPQQQPSWWTTVKLCRQSTCLQMIHHTPISNEVLTRRTVQQNCSTTTKSKSSCVHRNFWAMKDVLSYSEPFLLIEWCLFISLLLLIPFSFFDLLLCYSLSISSYNENLNKKQRSKVCNWECPIIPEAAENSRFSWMNQPQKSSTTCDNRRKAMSSYLISFNYHKLVV